MNLLQHFIYVDRIAFLSLSPSPRGSLGRPGLGLANSLFPFLSGSYTLGAINAYLASVELLEFG